jgi:hypothetical protein
MNARHARASANNQEEGLYICLPQGATLEKTRKKSWGFRLALLLMMKMMTQLF